MLGHSMLTDNIKLHKLTAFHPKGAYFTHLQCTSISGVISLLNKIYF